MELFVIGGFRLHTPIGQFDRLRTRKTEALLLWMALHPRGAPRPYLLDLFWPEDDPTDARRKLRLALHSIRQAVGDRLIAEGDRVRVDPIAIDIQSVALDADAVILPGVDLPWLDDLRRSARVDSELAIVQQYRRAVQEHDHRTAVSMILQLLPFEVEPPSWYEPLYDHLMALEEAVPARLVASLAVRTLGTRCPEKLRPAATPRVESSNLIGRAGELAVLVEALLSMREPVAIGLVGPGGVGKTRLARELMRLAESEEIESRFLTAADDLVPEELPSTLIVLDNAEDLTEADHRKVQAWLAPGSAIRLLITSQRELPVAGIRWIRLAPLGIPANDQRATLSRSEAVQLLCRSAELELTGENAKPIGQIVRDLGGLPLALRLVGRQIALHGLEPVGVSLWEALRAEGPAQESRHRSLAASLEWSFARLSDAARDCLFLAAGFEDKFTTESAAAVGISPESLRQAIDASFIHREQDALELLPPVRRFLRERTSTDIRPQFDAWLSAQIFENLATQTANVRRYCLIHATDLEREPRPGIDPQTEAARLMAYYFSSNAAGHIQRFEQRAEAFIASQPDPTSYLPLLNLLGSAAFFLRKLDRAAELYAFVESHAESQMRQTARSNRGLILLEQGRFDEAIPLLEEALTPRPPLRRRWAALLASLASAHMGAGRAETALNLIRQVQTELADDEENGIYLAVAYGNESEYELECGRLDEAERAAVRAAALYAHLGERSAEIDLQVVLALIAARRGDRRTAAAALTTVVSSPRDPRAWMVALVTVFHLLDEVAAVRGIPVQESWMAHRSTTLRSLHRSLGIEITVSAAPASLREIRLMAQNAVKRL